MDIALIKDFSLLASLCVCVLLLLFGFRHITQFQNSGDPTKWDRIFCAVLLLCVCVCV